MFITAFQDSKILQVLITTITKGAGKVTRSKVKESITVNFPKKVIIYPQYIGGLDLGDHQRLMS